MKRACLAVMFLAASSGVANAGYLGLGIGTGPAIDSDTAAFESVGRSARFLAGTRWSQISLEGSVGGFDMVGVDRNATYDTYNAAVTAKLSLPLGNDFEAFGKAGLQRAWLKPQGKPEYDVEGNGYLIGAGFEYRFPLGSLWLDYTYSTADLSGERQAFDLSARMWTLGLSVGI